MKFYEMRDIYRFMVDELQPEKGPVLDRYVEAMDRLFDSLEPYFTPDKANNYPSIPPEAYQEISAIFDEAVSASTDFIHSYDNLIEPDKKDLPPISAVTMNLNDEFLSKAYVEFKNIKPDPHFSLKEQMEEFRYSSVELGQEEIKKLSGCQSNRLQMSVELDGKKVKGVFTPITTFQGKKSIEEIFPRIKDKYPQFKSFFEAIDVDKFYDNSLESSPSANFFDEDGDLLEDEDLTQGVRDYVLAANFDPKVARLAEKLSTNPDFALALADFATQVNAVRTPIRFNRDGLGMKEGDRIDSRNSAMSSVANLIGCPDVIAKSRPLVIYDDKGHKYQEGTFMEFAEGKDINAMPAVDEMRLKTNVDFDTPEVKAKIADLQVLDFICGNIDRHGGNILYSFDDKTGKLIDIKGIDNDSAFLKNPLGINDTMARLMGANRLKVINEEMAERIKNLNEGELKATLHGFGLDKESVDAAWQRTLQLKQAIQNGRKFEETGRIPGPGFNPYITIMKKEDYERVSFVDIHQGNENYFETVESIGMHAKHGTRIADYIVEQKNAARAGLKTALGQGQTGYLLKKAKDASPWFFASTRYKNIVSKVKEYHETPLEGEDPLPKSNPAKWAKLMELKGAIAIYKDEKIRDGAIDENWNSKRGISGKDLERMNLVKDMESYIKSVEQGVRDVMAADKAFLEEKRKVDEINAFVNKSMNEKKSIIAAMKEKQALEGHKDEPEVINALPVSHNINASMPVKQDEESFLDVSDFSESMEKKEEIEEVEAIENEAKPSDPTIE